MAYLHVRNVTRDADLGQKVRVASSFMRRAVGLLSASSLGTGEGLWISPCSSVHTLFMRFPIDILFLDSEGLVLDGSTVVPWRISTWVRRSRGVLEIPAGTIKKTGTRVGDRIEMKGVN